MGTKLKNIATNSITKVIVWIIFLVFISLGVRSTLSLFSEIVENDYDLESVFISHYVESDEFETEAYYIFHDLLEAALMVEGEVETEGNIDYLISYGNHVQTNIPNSDKNYYLSQKYHVTYEYVPYEYSSTAGGESFDNSKELEEIEMYSYYYMSEPSWNASTPPAPVNVYFSFHEDWVNEQQILWEESRNYFIEQVNLTSFLITCVIATISALYLMIFAGTRPKQETLKLYTFDKLYSEVGLLFLFALFVSIIGIYVGVVVLEYQATLNASFQNSTNLAGIATILVVTCFALVLALCLSFIRKIKARMFWRTSLTGRFFIWLWKLIKRNSNWLLKQAKRFWTWLLGIVDYFKKFFDGRAYDKYPFTKKLHQMQRVFIITTLVIAFLAMITIIFLGGMILFIAQGVITYWYIKGTKAAYDDINQGITDIQVEQRKSENTKTELITNVSHDLKTPLTSIITYVDLLSKEEDLSDSAKDYVKIISQKSERLNHMVSDLFDLSKSAGGNLSMEIEILDYKKLVEQTLADMKDKVDESGMTVRTSFPTGSVMIRSDGKKLYRVFQNIIDNALKYSLKGSRIFVSVEVQDGKAIATVKNTAGYEIEFTEEEILQRFTRGDKARSSDGSGLGLSIAESFTQSCGGEFKLELDGDLFKVTMTFPVLD